MREKERKREREREKEREKERERERKREGIYVFIQNIPIGTSSIYLYFCNYLETENLILKYRRS